MSDAENPTVLVTGASGFVGGHCVIELLGAGYRVRGTLRSLSREASVRAAIGKHADVGRFDLVEADLSSRAGWAEAVRGCRYVLHVASPVPRQPPKHPDDLIVPARDGALRVLEAASEAGVERVVMTSSLAAVLYGHDRKNGRTFDETTWSIIKEGVGAYERSKTIAERAAWDYVAALPEGKKIELVTINPGLILGPVLDEDYGTSGEVVRKLMRREVPGCPPVGWAIVDVRDVARMHVLAMTKKEAAGQRFVCAGEHAWFVDIARILKKHFEPRGFRVPTAKVPGFVLRFLSLFDETLRLAVNDLDLRTDVSHRKATELLGWRPRGLEEAVVSMGESLIANGVV